MGVVIVDDTIIPAPNGYPDLTPKEEHTRNALLLISLFGPITGAGIILYYTRKTNVYWNFPNLAVFWLLSVSIFGTLLHFEQGHTTRLTFIVAIFHTQIEVLITSLFLKQSAPIGLFAAWIWGLVTYAVTLLSESIQTVFLWTSILGGGNDIFMALLLLYGKEYLYAFAFLAHVSAAIIVFTNSLIFISIVPYTALVFFSLWPFIGITTLAILRSENIWAKESATKYHKFIGRFRSPGTSRSTSDDEDEGFRKKVSDKVESLTKGKVNLVPDEGERHLNFRKVEKVQVVKTEEEISETSGSRSSSRVRDKISDKIEKITNGKIDFTPEEGEHIIQIHSPEGKVVDTEIKSKDDSDAKSNKSNSSRTSRKERVSDKIEQLTGGLVDLTPENGERVVQFNRNDDDNKSTSSRTSIRSKGKGKEVTVTEQIVAKSVEKVTKGRINLNPEEGENHFNLKGHEPSTIDVITKKVTDLPGDAAEYVKDTVVSTAVENMTKGRIILRPGVGEHHINLSNDDWGILQSTFEEPKYDEKIIKHHVNPTRNPLYKIALPKVALYQLAAFSLAGSTAIAVTLVIVAGHVGH